ncbi:hypothetical protein [Xanthobacter pseudotagetidis]|uniref:hypothetical protein n=1 Tax=Xanthobacter pseudotagetidis TaxID=3119911 RepID=UPI00372C8D43
MRLALAAVLFAFSAALSGAAAAEVEFPRGSIIGLVPPEGMSEGRTFSGFEDRDKNAALLLVDMPAEAFPQLEASFTDAALAEKGIKVETRVNFPVTGAKGILVTGTQAAGAVTLRKWVLLAGNDMLTALVTFQVPESAAVAYPDATVRAALSTLAFRSAREQVEALPYTLNDLAGFRVVRTLGGSTVILTDGPKNVVDGAEQPYFVVTVAGGAPREDERGRFAVRTLAGTPGVKDIQVERAEPLRLANHMGYEVMAKGVDMRTGAPVKVVQWMRFGTTGYMRMVGVTPLDSFPELYPRLRAIRDGVEPR